LTYSSATYGQSVYYSISATDSSSLQNVFQSDEKSFPITETAQLDDFEGPIGPWIFTERWGVTSQFSHSGSHSIEDSPSTAYAPNSDSYAQWGSPLELTNFLQARLRFWEMHLLSPGGDSGRFEISADNGPWQPLLEVTGVNANWTFREIMLDSLCGGVSQEVRFRFRVITDGQGELHGWFIDDLSISVDVFVPAPQAPTELAIPAAYALGPIFPNPFNARSTIHFDLPSDSYFELEIYDLAGRRVKVLREGHLPAGSHRAVLDGSELGAGLYFCRLKSGNFQQVQKLILLK
jgi:hypothetical protein